MIYKTNFIILYKLYLILYIVYIQNGSKQDSKTENNFTLKLNHKRNNIFFI